MLDAAAIISGAIGGAGGEQITRTFDRVMGQDDPHGPFIAQVLYHLANIDQALNPESNPNYDDVLVLQGYPYEYVTDGENHQRAHLSIFFVAATPARFDIPGVGTYLKSVGPGWIQCDLPGHTRISTTDSLAHPVIVSYRIDPIGAAL